MVGKAVQVSIGSKRPCQTALSCTLFFAVKRSSWVVQDLPVRDLKDQNGNHEPRPNPKAHSEFGVVLKEHHRGIITTCEKMLTKIKAKTVTLEEVTELKEAAETYMLERAQLTG